jgi:hypothetical protein
MGSPWNRGRNEEETVSADSLALTGPTSGLEASELDMLRHMPDYDAEEMSTVRPAGGWPELASPPAAAFQPATPVVAPASAPVAAPPAWAPPNRVEPPTSPAWSPPNQVTPPAAWTPPNPTAPVLPASPGAQPVVVQHRFPEERTVALMAEDLLGRPLDEPPPVQLSIVRRPSSVVEPESPSHASRPATNDSNLWDQVMPLHSEG